MIGHEPVAVAVWKWEMSVGISGEGRVNRHDMTPDNTEFVLLCFEGPDPYAMAGGLGMRVDYLSRTLAELGFSTHLFFIGDPQALGGRAEAARQAHAASVVPKD
jgi:hypothetical protein